MSDTDLRIKVPAIPMSRPVSGLHFFGTIMPIKLTTKANEFLTFDVPKLLAQNYSNQSCMSV